MTQVSTEPVRTSRHRRRAAAFAAAVLLPASAGIALISAGGAHAATIPTAPPA